MQVNCIWQGGFGFGDYMKGLINVLTLCEDIPDCTVTPVANKKLHLLLKHHVAYDDNVHAINAMRDWFVPNPIPFTKEWIIDEAQKNNGVLNLLSNVILDETWRKIDKRFAFLYLLKDDLMPIFEEWFSDLTKNESYAVVSCRTYKVEKPVHAENSWEGFKVENLPLYYPALKERVLEHIGTTSEPTIVISDDINFKGFLKDEAPKVKCTNTIPIHTMDTSEHSLLEILPTLMEMLLIGRAVKCTALSLFTTHGFSHVASACHEVPYYNEQSIANSVHI